MSKAIIIKKQKTTAFVLLDCSKRFLPQNTFVILKISEQLWNHFKRLALVFDKVIMSYFKIVLGALASMNG